MNLRDSHNVSRARKTATHYNVCRRHPSVEINVIHYTELLSLPWRLCLCIVLMKALLRDTCNARRTPWCILLNLAAVGCTLQWNSEAEINKYLQLLFEKTLPLKLRHSDVIVMQSWYYFFSEVNENSLTQNWMFKNVRLSVIRITRKVVNEFWRNFWRDWIVTSNKQLGFAGNLEYDAALGTF